MLCLLARDMVGVVGVKNPFGVAWRKIKSITVSGYPATYKNFRSPEKDYWTAEALWLTQDAIEKSKSKGSGFSGLAGAILKGNK